MKLEIINKKVIFSRILLYFIISVIMDCPQNSNDTIQGQIGHVYPPWRDFEHFVKINVKQYAS